MAGEVLYVHISPQKTAQLAYIMIYTKKAPFLSPLCHIRLLHKKSTLIFYFWGVKKGVNIKLSTLQAPTMSVFG